MMIEKLQSSPDDLLSIDDDRQAEVFLLELGVLDRFKRESTHGDRTQALIDQGQPTHYIVAVLYKGYPAPEDNGFKIGCYPKSRWTLDEIVAFVNRLLEPSEGEILAATPVGEPPGLN